MRGRDLFHPGRFPPGGNDLKHTDITPSIFFQLTKEGLFEVMVSYGQSTRSGSSLEVLHWLTAGCRVGALPRRLKSEVAMARRNEDVMERKLCMTAKYIPTCKVFLL